MSFVKILFPQFGFNAHYFNELVSLDGNTIAMIKYTFCVHLQEFKINETLPSCEILEQNAGRNTQQFYKGYEPSIFSKDIMASRRYICTYGYRWMISLLFSLTGLYNYM